MKAFKPIAAVVPGPAVLLLTQWFDLFSRTSLPNPEWQQDATNTALAGGSVIAVMIAIQLKEWTPQELRALAWRLLKWTAGAFALCLAVSQFSRLGIATVIPGALLQVVWFLAFLALMLLVTATISVGAMSLREQSPMLFWLLFILGITVIAAIIGYVIWRLL